MKISSIRGVQWGAALMLLGTSAVVYAAFNDPSPNDAAPAAIPFRGELSRDGNPVTGTASFQATLWDAPTAGNKVWGAETHDGTQVENGHFTIVLGSNVNFGKSQIARKPLYLELAVKVDGLDSDYAPLMGRQRLLSSPYAVSATYATHGVPAGTVVAFMGAVVPYGWALCDGSALSGAQYPELSAALGAGGGNFNLPNLQGQFLRGAGGARAVRTPQAWATGYPKSEWTTSTTGSHSHSFTDNYLAFDTAGGTFYGGIYDWDDHWDNKPFQVANATNAAGDHAHTVGGGDAETRPDNIAVNWIIKL